MFSKILGGLILLGLIALCSYLIFTFVRDFKKKHSLKNAKSDKKENDEG